MQVCEEPHLTTVPAYTTVKKGLSSPSSNEGTRKSTPLYRDGPDWGEVTTPVVSKKVKHKDGDYLGSVLCPDCGRRHVIRYRCRKKECPESICRKMYLARTSRRIARRLEDFQAKGFDVKHVNLNWGPDAATELVSMMKGLGVNLRKLGWKSKENKNGMISMHNSYVFLTAIGFSGVEIEHEKSGRCNHYHAEVIEAVVGGITSNTPYNVALMARMARMGQALPDYIRLTNVIQRCEWLGHMRRWMMAKKKREMAKKKDIGKKERGTDWVESEDWNGIGQKTEKGWNIYRGTVGYGRLERPGMIVYDRKTRPLFVLKFCGKLTNIQDAVYYELEHAVTQGRRSIDRWFGAMSYNVLGCERVGRKYHPVLCQGLRDRDDIRGPDHALRTRVQDKVVLRELDEKRRALQNAPVLHNAIVAALDDELDMLSELEELEPDHLFWKRFRPTKAEVRDEVMAQIDADYRDGIAALEKESKTPYCGAPLVYYPLDPQTGFVQKEPVPMTVRRDVYRYYWRTLKVPDPFPRVDQKKIDMEIEREELNWIMGWISPKFAEGHMPSSVIRSLKNTMRLFMSGKEPPRLDWKDFWDVCVGAAEA